MSVYSGSGTFKAGNPERPGVFGLTESERSFFKKALWEGCRESTFITKQVEDQFLAWIQKTEESSQALHLIRLGAKILTFSQESGELTLLIPNRNELGGYERKTFQI